jgi:signal transduction histidine kinase
MPTLVDSLFLVSMGVGGVLWWVGYRSYRRWDEPGATQFAAFTIIWGTTPVAAGLGTVAGETIISLLQVLLWCLATVPWFLFTLQYTGSYTRVRPWLLGLLAAPALVLVPWLLNQPSQSAVLELLSTLVFSFYSTLAIIGAVLVLWTTHRYGHLSLKGGGALAVAGLLPFLTMTSFGILSGEEDTLFTAGIYAGGFLCSLTSTGLALFHYDVFDSTPAAGTIGERAIARESEDLIVIADTDGRIIMLNETATTELDVDRRGSLGTPIEDRLGLTVNQLRNRETVELQTARGGRQFDPQVTALTDQHDRELGAIVILRDVTEREMRRQRLEVLNRIVRHNLRNQVSVIKANTEAVAAELDEGTVASYLDSTTGAADSLATLGRKAKRIEELFSREASPRSLELDAFLDELVAERSERWPEATFTVEADAVTVECDREMVRFVVDNLVENAVEHTPRDPHVELSVTVTDDGQYPVAIDVVDNGPGIPEQEIEVIREGTERPLKHGSGIGLWVTNWAVKDLGGELTFHEREGGGTRVRVLLPNKPQTSAFAMESQPADA